MARRWFFTVLVSGLGIACAGKAYLLDGDADYARVAYGGDMESATARRSNACRVFASSRRTRPFSIAFDP